MIEDILKANPGMRETYRAYAREKVLSKRIEELELKKRSIAKCSANEQELKQIEVELTKYREALEASKLEVKRCLELESAKKKKLELVR